MDVYTQFVGKKVLVNKSTRTMKIGDKDYSFDEYEIAPEDTTISEMEKEIGSFRLWLPNTRGTMDSRPNRINVRVEEQSDGSFEITKVYHG